MRETSGKLRERSRSNPFGMAHGSGASVHPRDRSLVAIALELLRHDNRPSDLNQLAVFIAGGLLKLEVGGFLIHSGLPHENTLGALDDLPRLQRLLHLPKF